LGAKGELKAKSFLKKKGYKILATNYTTKLGEVDLIGLYGDFLVFVEVKTRTNKTFGEPSEAVNFIKQQHIKNAAQAYIMQNNLFDLQPRFDVIEILNKNINHIEDAF
jgi:putative endonuclease